jgi:hypothetical protein
MSEAVDPENGWGDVALRIEMEAGKVYFFTIREMGGQDLDIKFMITKAPYANVTFHANRDSQGDAWFDDDPSLTAKTIPIAIGEEIHSYSRSGLTYADPEAVLFSGWSTDPDKAWVDDYVIVEGDMDVYALAEDKIMVTLDANGGYFRLADNAPVIREQFAKGTAFVTRNDPRISDNTIKFAGWSRNPDALVPDEDIIERVTPAEELNGVTLYAVYGEKVLEIFNGNGGYFLGNPENTVYESTKGKGHVFYGMVVHHPDPRMKCIGWVDQNGVYIPYEIDAYPYYHVNEDTEYTAQWGYEVRLDANGGIFAKAGSRTLALPMEYDGLFSLANYSEMIGEAVNYDGSKYFAGWATTPDAEEPDVFEGVTKVRDIDTVYAVWKDDTYYWADGEHGTWTKGSEEGLTFTVKRKGDDRETFPAFKGAYINDTQIYADSFKTAEGSLIFTLLPEYLETLPAGSHKLTLSFNETDMETDFTIEEPSSEEPAEITYTITKGNDGSWTKASKQNYTFTVKRSELDEQGQTISRKFSSTAERQTHPSIRQTIPLPFLIPFSIN